MALGKNIAQWIWSLLSDESRRSVKNNIKIKAFDILFQLMAYLPAQTNLLTWSDNFTMEYCLSIKVGPSPFPSHRVKQGSVLAPFSASCSLPRSWMQSRIAV